MYEDSTNAKNYSCNALIVWASNLFLFYNKHPYCLNSCSKAVVPKLFLLVAPWLMVNPSRGLPALKEVTSSRTEKIIKNLVISTMNVQANLSIIIRSVCYQSTLGGRRPKRYCQSTNHKPGYMWPRFFGAKTCDVRPAARWRWLTRSRYITVFPRHLSSTSRVRMPVIVYMPRKPCRTI